MAMYAISVLSLINVLRECDVNQTWFADDPQITLAYSSCGQIIAL